MSEDFQPGALLAGYRLEDRIGAGGMAVVWRARDERLGRPVALKMLAPSLAEVRTARERFLAEAQLAAQVDHPNIVKIHFVGEADGVPFIAMQLIRGEDLQKLLDRERMLPPARAMEFISPVASALDAAHAAGLVHRDVKPGNILVDTQHQSQQVYLTDFGIAKARTSPGITEPGKWLGTAAYSAPEQIRGLPVDGRADQYSLACVAYRLLTGTSPFPRDQVMAVLLAHETAPPPRLTALQPDLPEAADGVLLKAMAKTPDERFESCGVFAGELLGALGVLPYSPGRFTTRPASPGHLAPRPYQSADASPAFAATRAEPQIHPPTVPSKADEFLRTLQAPPQQAQVTPKTSARRRRRTWRKLGSGVTIAAVAAAVAAVVIVLVAKNSGTPGPAVADVVREGAFPGYQGQHGSETVDSFAAADGTVLAAGSADGHAAIWRRTGHGSWKLVSADSAAVNQLSGVLTGIAHGPQGWIAVGDPGNGQSPVALISSDGMNWQQNGATFHGNQPSVQGVAVRQGDYVVTGTQVSTQNGTQNPVATMWWSTDLLTWHRVSNTYNSPGQSPVTINGGEHPSSVDAVTATPTGTFYAVGSAFGKCAIWYSPASAQDWDNDWTYVPVHRPSGASSAALQWVTANKKGVAVAGGYAVEKGGDVPIVVVVNGSGEWHTIVLQAPGGHGTVTGLTATSSGFVVAGEVGPARAQRAVTWNLPDSGDPRSSWPGISPLSRSVQKITALYAAGNAVTGAVRQGQAANAVGLPEG